MILEKLCTFDEDSHPLRLATLPEPIPGKGEIVIKVSTCGVCHTELDEIEGRTPPPVLPMVLGHQVVGLDAVIDTTPAWKPVMDALQCLKPGGRLVINAIRKESRDNSLLTQLDYPKHLWMEKDIKSVANVTRRDVREFLKIAAEIPIKPEL